MAKDVSPPTAERPIEIDLREPGWAALYAWLWPGAGHFYQRRYAKGILFMVCILGTYFFGLAMGGGQCVYASYDLKNDFRWQYVCQLGVGAPALPAIPQAISVWKTNKPILTSWMAPPGAINPIGRDQLADWHLRYNSGFELGTLFTIVAGLLNVLAIYDAYAGPMMAVPEEETKPPDEEKDKKKT